MRRDCQLDYQSNRIIKDASDSDARRAVNIESKVTDFDQIAELWYQFELRDGEIKCLCQVNIDGLQH